LHFSPLLTNVMDGLAGILMLIFYYSHSDLKDQTLMNFSLEQLQSFVAVYEKGSFSEAAIELGKHRTTIGQVITNLEDVLAVELFERVGRKSIPTKDAQLLYHYAKLTISQAQAFDDIALSLSYGTVEAITVAYCSFIPNDIIVRIRMVLEQQFPSLKVNFIIRNQQQVKQGIEAGDIHFGLVNVDDRTPRNHLDSTFLTYISFALYASEQHPLSRLRKENMLGGLKTHRQLVLKSHLEDSIADKIRLSPDIESVDDIALLITLVQQGLGYAILPRITIHEIKQVLQVRELECAELKENIRFPVSLWSPHNKAMLDIKKVISDTTLSYIKEQQQKNWD